MAVRVSLSRAQFLSQTSPHYHISILSPSDSLPTERTPVPMAQQTQISISAPTLENAMPHSPTLAAKRSHEQIEPVTEAAPVLKKVKTNDDDTHEVVDTKMEDVGAVKGQKEVQEMEHSAALAVLDDGVKESDAASGRSAWCMELGEY